jgi:hypothetical protein
MPRYEVEWPSDYPFDPPPRIVVEAESAQEVERAIRGYTDRPSEFRVVRSGCVPSCKLERGRIWPLPDQDEGPPY